MNNVTGETIARTIVLGVALLNQILVQTGAVPLDLDENTIYTAVSTVVTIGASIVAWWKNNSFTQKAIKADATFK